MAHCNPSIGPASPTGRATVAALIALLLSACSLDGLLLTEFDRKGHQAMPDPAPTLITGHVPALPGAQVQLLSGDGLTVGQTNTTAAANGDFVIELEGSSELVGTVLEAAHNGRQLLGILPHVPAQKSVLAPAQTFDTVQLSPGMAKLDPRTTTLALLSVARARAKGSALSAIPHGSMTDTLIDLHSRLSYDEPKLIVVEKMIQRLLGGAPAGGSEVPFTLDPASASLLRVAFLAGAGLDYDGDDQPDATTAAFDAAIAAAITTFDFKACYRTDRIKVVLLVRMSDNAKDTACESINPFLWADDKPASRMFIAAGVHKDSPVCSATRTTHCLTQADIDALNATLGNWKPNTQAMYDDGTHGDGKANDNIWTLAFEAPWWSATTAPDGAGPRIAYKFTWGSEGKGWSGTEEFPGNQRILELNDINGDGLVVRFDHFADEASNKDKANGLPPSMGGCGELKWPGHERDGCITDALERQVDLDGDCKVDGWPPSGTTAPLSIPCPGESGS